MLRLCTEYDIDFLARLQRLSTRLHWHELYLIDATCLCSAIYRITTHLSGFTATASRVFGTRHDSIQVVIYPCRRAPD